MKKWNRFEDETITRDSDGKNTQTSSNNFNNSEEHSFAGNCRRGRSLEIEQKEIEMIKNCQENKGKNAAAVELWNFRKNFENWKK
jgi:hypothetical protein